MILFWIYNNSELKIKILNWMITKDFVILRSISIINETVTTWCISYYYRLSRNFISLDQNSDPNLKNRLGLNTTLFIVDKWYHQAKSSKKLIDNKWLILLKCFNLVSKSKWLSVHSFSYKLISVTIFSLALICSD